MLYVRFPLSLRSVEDLLHGRGTDVSHEMVRFWWNQFGHILASETRKSRIKGMRSGLWRWHLDEMFVRINGKRHYRLRADDHKDEVLESFVTRSYSVPSNSVPSLRHPHSLRVFRPPTV
jgi:putative transposase